VDFRQVLEVFIFDVRAHFVIRGLKFDNIALYFVARVSLKTLFYRKTEGTTDDEISVHVWVLKIQKTDYVRFVVRLVYLQVC